MGIEQAERVVLPSVEELVGMLDANRHGGRKWQASYAHPHAGARVRILTANCICGDTLTISEQDYRDGLSGSLWNRHRHEAAAVRVLALLEDAVARAAEFKAAAEGTVVTATELDEMPVGTVLLHPGAGIPIQKLKDGLWYMPGDRVAIMPATADELDAPLTILYRPSRP